MISDVIQQMGDWYPAEYNGKRVWTYKTLGERFKLEK